MFKNMVLHWMFSQKRGGLMSSYASGFIIGSIAKRLRNWFNLL